MQFLNNLILFCNVTTVNIQGCDKFWSAFCAFYAHLKQKTHTFKTCALKRRKNKNTSPKQYVFGVYFCLFILAKY